MNAKYLEEALKILNQFIIFIQAKLTLDHMLLKFHHATPQHWVPQCFEPQPCRIWIQQIFKDLFHFQRIILFIYCSKLKKWTFNIKMWKFKTKRRGKEQFMIEWGVSIGREESPLLAKLMFAPDVRPVDPQPPRVSFPYAQPKALLLLSFYSFGWPSLFPSIVAADFGPKPLKHPRKAKENGMEWRRRQCDLKKLNSLTVQYLKKLYK